MNDMRTIDFSVGLFILLGLASVLFLVIQTVDPGRMHAEDSYVLQARFDHVGDLKVRAPVALAGVTIGRVTAISVDPSDYRAIVQLRIDSNMDSLPIDTDASIATAGLLGGKYVELSPGGDEEYLKDHDEIVFTQSAILLESLIGKYMFNDAADE
jgi:phospholipid/cholesterol/gamma-HCH transport system substrate-binding protein